MLSALRAAARGALCAALRAPALLHALPPHASSACAAAAVRALSTSRPSLGVEEFLDPGRKYGEYPKAGAARARASCVPQPPHKRFHMCARLR
jgi:hypothetical protein